MEATLLIFFSRSPFLFLVFSFLGLRLMRNSNLGWLENAVNLFTTPISCTNCIMHRMLSFEHTCWALLNFWVSSWGNPESGHNSLGSTITLFQKFRRGRRGINCPFSSWWLKRRDTKLLQFTALNRLILKPLNWWLAVRFLTSLRHSNRVSFTVLRLRWRRRCWRKIFCRFINCVATVEVIKFSEANWFTESWHCLALMIRHYSRDWFLLNFSCSQLSLR